MTVPTLVWLRQDLRLDDQCAIAAAAARGAFAALYVLDDETPGRWAIGGAQRWWLHHSLTSIEKALLERGGTLILRKGRCADVVKQVQEELGAAEVHATRHYEPWWKEAESSLGSSLVIHPGDTLANLEEVRTNGGQRYRIYGPFARAYARLPVASAKPAPPRFTSPSKIIASDRIDDWNLLPTKPNWAKGFSNWNPGEDGAAERLNAFRTEVEHYGTARNLPSQTGTSMLSPHLHFGELSPRRLWHSLEGSAADKFKSELVWRDFSRNVIAADPHVGERDQRAASVRWRKGKSADADFRKWTKGQTGYPIIDAGMRQLWTIGWMHNRVRMLAASFLVKHLLLDWRLGAHWFWDTLVDADYGNNSQSWQWIAGTGFDSQPFGRIMAPLAQSAKFDAAAYIRRWVPELNGLSDRQIYDEPQAVDYPEPIVSHKEARERALLANRKPSETYA